MAAKRKPAKKVKGNPGNRPADAERHLGATEDRVGDRTGSGAGYDLGRSTRRPHKGGVTSS
jgi:hypothetical protein